MFGHDLSVLMSTPFAGSEADEFGKVNGGKLPLWLPKVKEGRPVTSTGQLLQLPHEILATIVAFIADDRRTLAMLAQVSRDCRQLAGSCQYADLRLDYSKISWHILKTLEREAQIRRSPGVLLNNVISPTFIGPCIRTLTVHSKPTKVADFHKDFFDVLWDRVPNRASPEKISELRDKALAEYLTKYRAPLLAAMEYAMPHLEAISWYDGVCLDDEFFRVVTNLPLRHLKLSNAHVGGAYNLAPSLAPAAMRLRSLYFDAELCQGGHHKAKQADTVSPLLVSLLRLCSSSLESLTIGPMLAEWIISFGYELVSLPELRYLDLSGTTRRFDTTAWRSFFSAPLKHLALPIKMSEEFMQVASTCPPLPDLETLVVPPLNRQADPTSSTEVLNFISRYPHIHKLSVGQLPPDLMNNHLVPLLVNGRWSNLTSLSLSWAGPGIDEATRPNIAAIPPESLALIGTLDTLEQLSLSAGESVEWRHQWLIDHEEVRWALRGLSKLKRLAFVRDTYVSPGLEIGRHLEAYYERYLHIELTPAQKKLALERPELGGISAAWVAMAARVNRDGVPRVPDDPELWERYHRNRMLREAEEYAAVLPKLEWIYCGQWPIGIKENRSPEGLARVAVPLHDKRDSCCTLRKRMFAMGQDGDNNC
ncbi:hypothetical protein jhhlp_004807 [Lomentospora prolificans]|uniref:F-box domain-containing protein n=1 Tax=Lomentospora prolificans TaxID=41688 RepID=A0A2N3N8L7_9PEZI|nr:hypothetical protein jhhlp_004807 [Lomentospora prolificans]